ncbi:hypothetical protein [Rhizobium sp. BK176]|uniref:hypothetical protein n=1 Tax=Rhizobium sp. BK176 TaxID=2587071 RepID=UPI002169954D|nr:hypothetical protein [Rhizobium sp. BK176]MCS4088714.1 hypothetical protein [Rhizobium sp. BK176]
MYVDYRYPALIRGRVGSWQKDRHILVSMTGRDEIEEIGYEDAPLAATVTMGTQKPVDFRVYGGRFYRMASEYGDIEFRSGLDHRIAEEIANACHLHVGKDIQPWPKNAAEFIRHSDMRRDGFRHARGEFLHISDAVRDQMLPLSSLAAFEGSDAENWEQVAAEYMRGLVMIDGHMWMPVREPMMAGAAHDRFPVNTIIDASIYDAKFDNPKDRPTPFGRREGFTSMFWYPSMRVYPLNADDDGLDGKMAPWMLPMEIRIPEVFGATYAVDEVDRVARVVVSELYSVCKTEYGTFKETPAKLREHLNETRRLLSSERITDEVADGIVRRLQLILCFIVGAESERSRPTHGHWNPDTIKALIKDTTDMWANREINIDVSWSPRSTGPSAP